MKILITGAGGFIGKRLAKRLSEIPGMEIYGLSREGTNLFPGVVPVRCDILDADGVERTFQNCRFDRVIHLAAITEHKEVVDRKLKTLEINLQGTMNLLNSFNRHCTGSQFLYASTGKVYGETDEMPISERALVNPTTVLGKAKRITENIVDFYAVPANRYLICRIFNIYGEFQKRNFVVPTILDQLDSPAIRLGNLHDKRDYLYIDDLIAAFLACIRSPFKFENVDYVNIGSGTAVSVADILKEMETLLGRKLQTETDVSRFRTDETSVEICDHGRLTERTGWEPEFTLREGMERTLKKEGRLP